MSAMSIRERLLAVYRNQVIDRVPVSIYKRYTSAGSGEREVRNLGLGILDFYPVASLISPPWHLHQGYLSEVRGADFQIRYVWEHGERIEIRSYDTPVGSVCQHTRIDPTYGSDWISKHYVQSSGDYRVLTYLATQTVLRANTASLQARRNLLGEDGVVLGRMDRNPYQKVLIELAGPERFLIDLQTEPDPVLELLDALDGKMNEAFELALDSDVDVIWQPDNVTSATTPPKYFERFLMPFYERHGRECAAAGKPYVVHMDGKLKALAGQIARAPINAVESLSVPESGGDISLREAASAWPGKILLPNFPAALCYRDRVEIEAFLERLFAEAPGGQPTMLQFSEDLPPSEHQRVVRLVCEFMARSAVGSPGSP